MRPRRLARGFTLVEMVAVVAIVGILAAAAMPMVELSQRRAQELELRRALRSLRDAIDAYKRAADAGLIEVPADASGYPPNLEVLVSGVPQKSIASDRASNSGSSGGTSTLASAGAKRLYLLRSLPRDPLADPSLPAAQTWALRSYDSPPEAPQAGRDVFDLHSMSRRRAIDGTAYNTW